MSIKLEPQECPIVMYFTTFQALQNHRDSISSAQFLMNVFPQPHLPRCTDVWLVRARELMMMSVLTQLQTT